MAGPEQSASVIEQLRTGSGFVWQRTLSDGNHSPSRERLLSSGGSPTAAQAAASGSSGVRDAPGPNMSARDEEGPADYAEIHRQPDKLWGSLLGDVSGPLVS